MPPPREFARRSVILFFCGLLVWGGAACASTPPAPPTPNSNVPTVLAPFTPDAPALQFPTLLPTVTAASAANTTLVVIIVTATPSPTPTVTRAAPTRPRATETPAATTTPFPPDVPRVYVTALRVEPPTPKANAGGTFFVTFQNASGQDDDYNWAVEIWDVENTKRPFGLTTPQNSPLPQGVSNFTSSGWTVKGLGECRAYRARVVARDDEDNRMTFIQPDGSSLWLDFNVCP